MSTTCICARWPISKTTVGESSVIAPPKPAAANATSSSHVAPWEAALGAKITVPTLERPGEMKIPPGAQAGQRLRLRGQGLNRRIGGRGDEYVKIRIVNPPKLTPKEKELFEKLAAESHFNARDLMAGG
ncbi:MAG TPA: DnaJ C-terminal domain-containing protein [Candidatus Binatia bacterium]|nr:DnaJ C-terminal domain-containing protein [Candidatus Binatia bacterium]